MSITYATIAASVSEYTGVSEQAVTAWLKNDFSAGYDLNAITEEIYASQDIPDDENALQVFVDLGVITDEMLRWLAE